MALLLLKIICSPDHAARQVFKGMVGMHATLQLVAHRARRVHGLAEPRRGFQPPVADAGMHVVLSLLYWSSQRCTELKKSQQLHICLSRVYPYPEPDPP